MKFKIFLINNSCQNVYEILGFCKSDWNLDLEAKIVEVSEPLKFADFGLGAGLDMYHTNRFNTDAVGYGAIVYLYHPEPNPFNKPLYNWTYTLDGRPQCQVVQGQWDSRMTAELMAHELCHAMWANLRCKGISVEDRTDMYPEGKEAILGELQRLQPYSDKLLEPLPIDKKIGILQQILAVAQQLLNLLTKPIGGKPLRELAEAMAQFEGFYIVGSRAWKNHNPLNLKYVGQPLAIGRDDKNFCIFKNDDDGWTTCLNDLRLKRDGKSISGLNGDSSVADLIKVWSEDNVDNYIKFVCQKLNITPDYKLKNFYG